MRIITINVKPITEAFVALKSGGLVVFPTETVYGIGADATNPKAIEKLNNYKQRPFGKPYSIAVSDIKMAEEYVSLNSTARNLYRQFLPGPITIVSKGKHQVAPLVESETGTLGIRIPDYKLVVDLVKKLGKPITATSANASYKKRPYKIADILENISDKQKRLIDLIIDAGELPPSEPSTVIDTTTEDLVVLRQGEIKLKNKDEILSKSEEATQNLGKELWHKYQKHAGKRPIIFALEGPMGAGKTQFTKGLGRAMGIKEEITSPTFNLVSEYAQLNHIDAWRMEKSQELTDLGFDQMLLIKNSVFAIEWAEKVIDVIKKHTADATIIWVKIAYLPAVKAGGQSENERLISWGVI